MMTYHPVQMRHPLAGIVYGLAGEECDEGGTVIRNLLIPDISHDYDAVSRLAAACTAGQPDREQILDLLSREAPQLTETAR